MQPFEVNIVVHTNGIYFNEILVISILKLKADFSSENQTDTIGRRMSMLLTTLSLMI